MDPDTLFLDCEPEDTELTCTGCGARVDFDWRQEHLEFHRRFAAVEAVLTPEPLLRTLETRD